MANQKTDFNIPAVTPVIIVPDIDNFGEKSDTPGDNDYAHHLDSFFENFVFEKLLKEKYFKNVQAFLDHYKEQKFEHKSFKFEYKDEHYIFYLDEYLFENLCKLYFKYGWDVIELIKNKIESWGETTYINGKKYPKDTAEKFDHYNYFITTIKCLGLLIRNSLIGLEQKSRSSLIRLIKDIKNKTEKAIDRLGLKVSESARPEWVMSEEAAGEILPILQKAAQKRKELNEKIQEIKEAKTEAEIMNSIIVAAMGFEIFTSPQTIWYTAPDQQEEVQKLSEELHDSLMPLQKINFLALLIFPSLSDTFYKWDIERELGPASYKFQKLLDDIEQQLQNVPSSTFQSNTSYTQTLVPWKGEEKLQIENFEIEKNGIEQFVIEGFFKKEDISLLNESILESLVISGEVKKDSFEYCVLNQYRIALQQYYDILRAKQDKTQEKLTKVGKMGAILSILSLIPGLNEMAIPAKILDVSLKGIIGISMYYSYKLISDQQDIFDNLVKNKTADTALKDAESLQEVLELTNLVFMREQFNKEVATQIMKEVVILYIAHKTQEKINTGSTIPYIKQLHRAIQLRFFYNDIESIYE